jgi:F420H(2)-dependent quinone reductase
MQRFIANMTHTAQNLGPLGRWFGRAHALVFRKTHGRLGSGWFGAPVLLLVTVGRRTGQIRETPLLYVKGEAPGSLALLGAAAGSDHAPGWWHNLTASETVDVILHGTRTTMHWHEALGDEHTTLMTAFTTVYPAAGHYTTFTDRHLPIAVLTPAAG